MTVSGLAAEIATQLILRASNPAASNGFKIMGLRNGAAHSLIVAVARIDCHIRDAQHYLG